MQNGSDNSSSKNDDDIYHSLLGLCSTQVTQHTHHNFPFIDTSIVSVHLKKIHGTDKTGKERQRLGQGMGTGIEH
jgi:hypothetical protein